MPVFGVLRGLLWRRSARFRSCVEGSGRPGAQNRPWRLQRPPGGGRRRISGRGWSWQTPDGSNRAQGLLWGVGDTGLTPPGLHPSALAGLKRRFGHFDLDHVIFRAVADQQIRTVLADAVQVLDACAGSAQRGHDLDLVCVHAGGAASHAGSADLRARRALWRSGPLASSRREG